MRSHRGRMAAILTLLPTALLSCGGSPSKGSPLPASSPVIEVTAREYTLAVKGSLSAGRVVFRTVNAGAETHNPALVALDDDVPPIDSFLRQTDRRPIRAFAGTNPRGPGANGTFAVDLVAGRRYAFVCFTRTAAGERHAEKGMTWEGRADAAPVTTQMSRP